MVRSEEPEEVKEDQPCPRDILTESESLKLQIDICINKYPKVQEINHSRIFYWFCFSLINIFKISLYVPRDFVQILTFFPLNGEKMQFFDQNHVFFQTL